jgi:spore coat protein CotF
MEEKMNNKVQNPKIELDSSIEMNDENYLNDILETEKNMSVNFTYALNEASNETLFNEIYEMFKQIKEAQRNLFELSFRKGFYTLEKAETNKINEEYNTLLNKFNEIE